MARTKSVVPSWELVEMLKKAGWKKISPYTDYLEREYSFEAAGQTISGIAQVRISRLKKIFSTPKHNQSVDFQWKSTSEAQHPHAVGSSEWSTLCFSISSAEFEGIPEEVRHIAAAGAITHGPEIIRPEDLASREWGRCHRCDQLAHHRRMCWQCYHVFCDQCGLRRCEQCGEEYCERCYRESHQHGVSVERRLNPEEIPSTRDADFPVVGWRAQIGNRRRALVGRGVTSSRDLGPSSRIFLRAFLIGCGITGSWVLPVLLRHCDQVTAFDPDRVTSSNYNGLWPVRRHSKVFAVATESHLTRFTGLRRKFDSDLDESLVEASPNLVVICADNAPARISVYEAHRRYRTAIVDIRVAEDREHLVVWAFGHEGYSDESNSLRRVWRESLEGYAEVQSCDFHDNVSMSAGTMAAAFMSWWFSKALLRDYLVGMWVVPLTFDPDLRSEVHDAHTETRTETVSSERNPGS